MKQEKKRPFFARFLESQELSKVKTGVKAGRPPITTDKWPSDDDEYPIPVPM